MSGSISPTAISAATPAGATASGTTSSQNALASLTNNFQAFLGMLTTQLQNQDPSSPMDSNQFTTELVQFAGVEQQINTNSSLTQLISLAQGSSVLQSSQVLGKKIEATSSQLPLQQGSAQVRFTAKAAGPVALTITDSAGNAIYTANTNASQGANSWTWNGQTATGAIEPDGNYGISVAAIAADGSVSAMPFTVVGTATKVEQQGTGVVLQLGTLPVNMSAVTSVGT